MNLPNDIIIKIYEFNPDHRLMMNIVLHQLLVKQSHSKMKFVFNELLIEFNQRYNNNECVVCLNTSNELFTEFIYFRKYNFCSYYCACFEIDNQRKYYPKNLSYSFYPNNNNFY
jgi:hypothetical protein